MGWLSFVLTNVLFTSVLLGGLRHEKALTVNPDKVRNDLLRQALVSSLQIGEVVWVSLKDLTSGASQGKR